MHPRPQAEALIALFVGPHGVLVDKVWKNQVVTVGRALRRDRYNRIKAADYGHPQAGVSRRSMLRRSQRLGQPMLFHQAVEGGSFNAQQGRCLGAGTLSLF